MEINAKFPGARVPSKSWGTITIVPTLLRGNDAEMMKSCASSAWCYDFDGILSLGLGNNNNDIVYPW